MIKLITIALFLISSISCDTNDLKWQTNLNSGKSLIKSPKTYPLNCGKGQTEEMGRIINGQDAQQWRWMVKLKIQRTHEDDDKDATYNECGATIIDQMNLITAGHCLEDDGQYKTDLVQIWIGAYDTKNGTMPGGQRILKAYRDDLVVHDLYNATTNENDIALIKLSKKLELGNSNQGNLQPICVSADPDAENVDTENCRILGWGLTQLGSCKTPDVLQEARVKILNDSTCQKWVDGEDYPYISQSMLCYGNDSNDYYGVASQCYGDSGGPLQCWGRKNRRWIQMGVASWSRNCGAGRFNPPVMTRVASYFDWIMKKRRLPKKGEPENESSEEERSKRKKEKREEDMSNEERSRRKWEEMIRKTEEDEAKEKAGKSKDRKSRKSKKRREEEKNT